MLSKQEKLARLRFLRSDSIGPSTFWSMIQLYGSAEEAIRIIPVLSKSSTKTINLCNEDKILEELRSLKSIGARMVFLEDDLYPPLLRNIPDPPPMLTFLGDREKALSFYKKNIVSVVGSRNSSIHANKFCSSFCETLGKKDVVVVSGLARGIDTQAHLGSIETGTIAVLAGGIDVIYPPENSKLYKEIAARGCIFSEMPYGTSPQPQLFPRRNRIIAGMSYGTVVVEAAENSGSLITARLALEYNRDVFAVPGFPLDPRSVGCNKLLKDGATLVQSAHDVLDCIEDRKIIGQSLFEERASFIAKISQKDLEKTQKKILNSLSSIPITIDELISSIKVSPQEVLTALLELELSSKVSRVHGQRVCLAPST
jgi:DNA processing protein